MDKSQPRTGRGEEMKIQKIIPQACEKILRIEAPSWRLQFGKSYVGDCGFCAEKSKTIFFDSPYCSMALFLHELAHVLQMEKGFTKTTNWHDSLWADEYTNLIRKYMKSKGADQ
jgi:hypothetical protein